MIVWCRLIIVECHLACTTLERTIYLLSDRISSDKTDILFSLIEGSWVKFWIGGETDTLPNSIPPPVLSPPFSSFHVVVTINFGLLEVGKTNFTFSFTLLLLLLLLLSSLFLIVLVSMFICWFSLYSTLFSSDIIDFDNGNEEEEEIGTGAVEERKSVSENLGDWREIAVLNCTSLFDGVVEILG